LYYEEAYSILMMKKGGTDWILWFTSIILATQEMELRRITFHGQSREKLDRPPSLSRAGCGGTHLLSKYMGKHKQEDCGSGCCRHKLRLFQK
jgi:hypothetical protein